LPHEGLTGSLGKFPWDAKAPESSSSTVDAFPTADGHPDRVDEVIQLQVVGFFNHPRIPSEITKGHYLVAVGDESKYRESLTHHLSEIRHLPSAVRLILRITSLGSHPG
jgi:hypothetical protein